MKVNCDKDTQVQLQERVKANLVDMPSEAQDYFHEDEVWFEYDSMLAERERGDQNCNSDLDAE